MEDNAVSAVVEFVEYDPDNLDTYPSVCSFPSDVKDRFGFIGGETLVFTTEGTFLGELTKMVLPVAEVMAQGG